MPPGLFKLFLIEELKAQKEVQEEQVKILERKLLHLRLVIQLLKVIRSKVEYD